MFDPNVASLHHAIDTFKSSLSLLLNLLLFYLIICHSTKQLQSYRNILLLTCVSDIFLSAIVLLDQPAMFFTGEGYMILVTNGPLANRWPWYDYIVTAMDCTFLHANITAVVVQFISRYVMICRPEQRHISRNFAIFALFWCAVQGGIAFWTFALGNTPELRDEALRYLDDIGWNYANSSVPYPILSSGLKIIFHHGFYTISCFGGYALIIWCQAKIWKHLGRHGSSYRESTRRMHDEVNRALLSLAVAPLLTLFGPLFVFLYFIYTKTSSGLYSSLLMVMASAITCVNPLTTIYFVRPFRRAVLSGFRFWKRDRIAVFSDTGSSKNKTGFAASPALEFGCTPHKPHFEEGSPVAIFASVGSSHVSA
ncbi:Protein Y9C9A.5 [Aphelenchoides avenae]|nr:Protein Y9C9A.5 [Aphelenchus avenae]